MVPIGALWLPLVLSGVAVFLTSAILWMVLPHHRTDFRKLPDEESVRDVLRKQTLAPGMYMLPYCKDMKQAGEPLHQKRLEEGPVGTLTMRPAGSPSMGLPLALSFLLNLVVALFVAYLTGRTVAPGADPLHVFRVAATLTLLAYGGALFYPSIWMGRPWSVTTKEFLDAAVYAIVTGGLFALLWPK